MSFVVDTNTCSAYVRGHPLVFNRFLQYSGRLFISVVTFGELTIWASRAKAPLKRAKEVQDLLKLVTILDVDVDIGRKFGEVQAALRWWRGETLTRARPTFAAGRTISGRVDRT